MGWWELIKTERGEHFNGNKYELLMVLYNVMTLSSKTRLSIYHSSTSSLTHIGMQKDRDCRKAGKTNKPPTLLRGRQTLFRDF